MAVNSARARRRGPYGMLYGPWLEQIAERGATKREILVLLALCFHLEFDAKGNARAWNPEGEMASRLGMSLDSIKKAKSGLKSKGLISVRSKSHPGLCTVYNIMPGNPWPSQGAQTEPGESGRTEGQAGGAPRRTHDINHLNCSL